MEDIDLMNDEYHLKELENLRYKRPSWEQTFMDVAEVISRRSKDPHTKVGAVLVKDNCIIGTGYNGDPRDCEYDFDWNTEEKYNWVIHAELNSICNACYNGCNVKGATIFVTLSPCHDCIKLIVQHGIKTVYYKDEYRDIGLTRKIADACGVKLIQFKR